MFQGFTPRAGSFLWELSLNNERPWFLAHKEEYKTAVEQPMRALTADTLEGMRARFPAEDLQPHLSRIYRDARRLYGGGPYRDQMWFSLQRGDTRAVGPMFWFELTPVSYAYGMGYWEAAADWGNAFRAAIDRDPAAFEGLIRALDGSGCRLWGQEYKRKKGRCGPLLDPWYNRKTVSVGWEFPFDEGLADPALPRRLTDAYAALMPLYRFFLQVYHRVLAERALGEE